MKKSIPGFITSLNLFFGFVSIIETFNGELKNALLCIIIAMILDATDGRIARFLNVEGEFGKELDSLADIVTFGVAPSIMLYESCLSQFGVEGLIISAIFPVCGALRLAKFNTETYKSVNYFVGLPITVAGGILAVFTLSVDFFTGFFVGGLLIVLSFLMISNLRFPSFKKEKIPKNFILILSLMIIGLYAYHKLIPDKFPLLLVVPLFIVAMYSFYKFKKGHIEITEKEENEEIV